MEPLNPFGTHQVLLRAIAERFNIKSVVEFGVGYYSTPFFLDRAVFPELSSLISVESQPKWAQEMSSRDLRHQMFVGDELRLAESFRFRADLAFVDGKEKNRIPLVLHSLSSCRLVVIHDIEDPVYQSVLSYAAFFHVDKSLLPWTAVLSSEVDVGKLF